MKPSHYAIAVTILALTLTACGSPKPAPVAAPTVPAEQPAVTANLAPAPTPQTPAPQQAPAEQPKPVAPQPDANRSAESAPPMPSRSAVNEPYRGKLVPLSVLGGARPRLGPGATGTAVEALQSALRMKHQYDIAVTGVYDAETERYVRQFQEHMGLPADGVAGSSTWDALISHFVELENSGPGFYRYFTDMVDSSWGTEQTLNLIRSVAAQWQQRGHGVRIGVNDISMPHGGPFPPHGSHRNGRDVDMYAMRNDDVEGVTTWDSTTYSRRLTQELVDLLYSTGQVELILFNDAGVRGVSHWEGHDDHLHVRFRP